MRYLWILLLSTTAWASEGESLAKQRACLGCHSIEHIGISYPPAFTKVSEQYKDNSEQIQHSIRYGKGKMPAHPTLTDAEILLLTNWILNLGKQQ
jgi:cytochrome c551/c552